MRKSNGGGKLKKIFKNLKYCKIIIYYVLNFNKYYYHCYDYYCCSTLRARGGRNDGNTITFRFILLYYNNNVYILFILCGQSM